MYAELGSNAYRSNTFSVLSRFLLKITPIVITSLYQFYGLLKSQYFIPGSILGNITLPMLFFNVHQFLALLAQVTWYFYHSFYTKHSELGGYI